MKNLKTPRRSWTMPICALLSVLTLAVYWQVIGFDFVNTDDPVYVVSNPSVHSGLSVSGIRWAFTSSYASNWHPLTWMSHMLDWQLFGPNPMGHHIVNVLLHLASVLLLFIVLKRMTGCELRSGFVAALFAIHPLHVESVAWVAERKDVLSALFWMLTMLAYARYAERPRLRRYVPVVLLFALGLMAKPMLVTLPLILLLLDYWPLNRLQLGWKLCVLEKAPLLLLSLASGALTVWAQNSGGAVATLWGMSVGIRCANALVAAAGYIVKMICPVNLASYYPHPGNTLPQWQVLGSALLFISMGIVAVWRARSQRYLLVGWLWYMITLLPVIGLVQVGGQAMADRYTYIPLIGLFVLIAWGVPEIPALRDWLRETEVEYPRRVRLAAVGLALLFLGLEVTTYQQVGDWRNSITLCEHAIEVTDRNFLAMNNLGAALVQKRQFKEGMVYFAEAVRLAPDFAVAHHNLGDALKRTGNLEGALVQYREAFRFAPDDVESCNGVALVLMRQGKLDEAFEYFLKVIELDPRYAEAYNNLGCIIAQKGKYPEAVEYFSKSLKLDPSAANVRANLENATKLAGKP